MATTLDLRVADRMRRAWAQLLRELDAEGVPAPAGANIHIRAVNGDLLVEAATDVDKADVARRGPRKDG